MSNSKGFPIGSRVLVDGKYEAIVKGYWPEGSSFYLFPHYTVKEVGSSDVTHVAVKRIGVKRAKVAA